MRFAFLMLVGIVLAFGGYVIYERSATTATMQRLGHGVHNLWHPDYPTGIP